MKNVCLKIIGTLLNLGIFTTKENLTNWVPFSVLRALHVQICYYFLGDLYSKIKSSFFETSGQKSSKKPFKMQKGDVSANINLFIFWQIS